MRQVTESNDKAIAELQTYSEQMETVRAPPRHCRFDAECTSGDAQRTACRPYRQHTDTRCDARDRARCAQTHCCAELCCVQVAEAAENLEQLVKEQKRMRSELQLLDKKAQR